MPHSMWNPLSCCCCCPLIAKSRPTLCNPMECCPPGASVHGISHGKNTGVGCHFLLWGIFLTQKSNLCLLFGFFTTQPPGKPSLLRPGIKSMFHALAGGFLSTGPPGKSSLFILFYFWLCRIFIAACGFLLW